MSRLIDADKLIDYTDDRYSWHEIGRRDRDEIVWALESAPTVEAVPVRHGKWIEYPTADGMNQCSACGVLRFGKSNYCPNCGSRMDAE